MPRSTSSGVHGAEGGRFLGEHSAFKHAVDALRSSQACKIALLIVVAGYNDGDLVGLIRIEDLGVDIMVDPVMPLWSSCLRF
jgi:hypothetical protein